MRQPSSPLDYSDSQPLSDSYRLMHELCVQQVELQAQNAALQRVQRALESARASYRDLYDFAPVGYCSVSVEGRVVQANLMFATLLEDSRTELLQQPFSALVQAADQAVYARMHRQLLACAEPQTCELRLHRRVGGALWVQLTASVALDSDGEPLVRIALSDISARKQAEEALRRREQFISEIINNLPGLVGYWSAELRCGFANQGYRHWFGHNPEDMLGLPLQALLGAELFERNQLQIEAVLAGHNQRFERTLSAPDGERGDFLVQYISDWQGGRVQGFFALLIDITSVRERQESVLSSQVQQHALLQVFPNLLFGTRREPE